MTDLLPCPFCGSAAEEDAIGYYHLGNESRHIQCANRGCRARPSVCRIQEEEGDFDLVEAWNARTPQPLGLAQGVPNPLQAIHDEVNALGGRPDQDNSYDQGIVDTVAKVLDIIESAQAACSVPSTEQK